LPAAGGAPVAAAERAWLATALLLGLLVVAGYVAVQLYLFPDRLGLPLDDSWIHLQFARNLARGAGLAINPGELVTGSTAPLWTGLVAALFLLPGGVIFWVKLLGAALYLVAGVFTFRLGRELGLGAGWASLAVALALVDDLFAWSALSGMEVPLFAALSLAGLLLHLRERRDSARPPLALGVLGLAMLARPEAGLLIACVVLDRLLVWRATADGVTLVRPDLKRLALGLVAAALVVVPVLVFYRWVGGTFLPSTFAAKTAGPSRWLPDIQGLYVIFGIFFRSQPWLALLAPAGAIALLARLGTRRDVGFALALWPFALAAVYSTFGGRDRAMVGNFGRYYFPLVPLLALLAVVAIARRGPLLSGPLTLGRLRLPLRAVGVVLLLAPGIFACARGSMFAAQNVINVEESDVRLAGWLAPRLDPRALLAVNDIGALKFLLPNRVLDLAGIGNPEAIEFYRREMEARRCTRDEAAVAFLEQRQPDFVAVFSSWFPAVDRAPQRFPPLLRIPIPVNITMGGDELVLYGTPWTRYPLRDVPPAGGTSR
jgi:hypothetical protein